jgi:hypothetical protein
MNFDLKAIAKPATFLAILILLMSSIVVNAQTIEVPSIYKEPQLYIENTELPKVKVGETFDLDLTILNQSIYTARDVYIKPQIEGTPFDSVELQNIQTLNRVLANQGTDVSFTFKVNEEATPGVYPLTIEFDYQNMYRDEYKGRSKTIYLEVIEAPNLPHVEVSGIKVNPENIKAGTTGDVTFFVENFGEQEASDISFRLTGLGESSFSITNDLNIRRVPSLEGEESTEFVYSLKSNENMQTGGHKVDYELKYKDRFGRTYTENGEVFLSVLAKDDDGEEEEDDDTTTVPKMIVSSYGTNPGIVRAGQNFTLNISFQNTSSIRTVRNIKISLTTPVGSSDTGNVFTPVNSSNTIFIDEISPRGVVTRNMPFYAVMDAQPRTYTVAVSFEYEDTNGEQFTANEEIGIRVIQQPRLETSDPQIPPMVSQGESFNLFTEFYNMGRTTIHNLMVKVEGDFEARNPNYFVGNFNSGNRDYFDTMLTAVKEGVSEGRIIYQFEDSAGEQQEVIQEFSIEVMPGMQQEPGFEDRPGMPGEYPEYPGGYPGMEEPSTPIWQKPLTWIIGLILIAAIVITLKRRKNKKDRKIEQDLLKDIEIDE